MPYALLTVGLVLFIAGIRDKHGELFALVKGDFTGDKNFVTWIAALAVIGGLGYIKPLKPLSAAFMTLLLIVLFLSNRGVIAKLSGYVQSPGTTAIDNTGAATQPLTPLPPLSPMDQLGQNLLNATK